MNNKEEQSLDIIRLLLDSQAFAVLSTQKNKQPYASLVAFAANPNCDQIFFLTPNTTRKYDNMFHNPRVAVLINNSINQTDDIYNAISVTATGLAETVEDHKKNKLLNIYLKKHPHLKVFSDEPTTALMRIKVDRYIMVNQFQNVIEVAVGS